jgi:hypothetical protein
MRAMKKYPNFHVKTETGVEKIRNLPNDKRKTMLTSIFSDKSDFSLSFNFFSLSTAATFSFLSVSLLPTQINEVLTHIFPMSFNPMCFTRLTHSVFFFLSERRETSETKKKANVREKEQKQRKYKKYGKGDRKKNVRFMRE